MRQILGLATIIAVVTIGSAATAASITWDEADNACTKALGSGCYAVAGDDGYPKLREGNVVCTCTAALVARPSVADRIRFGKRPDGKLVKMSPIPQGKLKRSEAR